MNGSLPCISRLVPTSTGLKKVLNSPLRSIDVVLINVINYYTFYKNTRACQTDVGLVGRVGEHPLEISREGDGSVRGELLYRLLPEYVKIAFESANS